MPVSTSKYPKLTILFLTISVFSPFYLVLAESNVEELRSKISSQTEEMKKLEADIAKYQAQVNATAKQTSTLQGAVNQLTATSKKLDAEIALSNKKISATTLNIEKLALEIKASERGIASNQDVIRETLRQMNSQDGISPLENSSGMENNR